jgi:hypothetical protein
MGSERGASVDDKKQTPFIEASASNFSDAGDNQENAYRFQSL